MTAHRKSRQSAYVAKPTEIIARRRSKPNRSTRAVAGVGLISCVTCGVFVALTLRRIGTVPSGFKVAGLSIGGLSVGELPQVTAAVARKFHASTIQLVVDLPNGKSRHWTATPMQLGLELDPSATVTKVLETIEGKGLPARAVSVWSSRFNDDIAPVEIVDEQATRKFLIKAVAHAIHREPVNARLIGTGNGLKAIPESEGVKLDLDQSVAAIRHLPLPDPSGATTVHLPIQVEVPRVSTDALRGIEDEISRFETRQRETGNRSRNIELACERINGTVLLPGDEFSYNKVVGPREPNYGYRSAKVIVRGKVEEGIGGGICQTSSTLFNAALLAGMKINRREHHGFPVAYVGVGRDATVVYGAIDFRFINSLDKPVAILADGRNRKVVIRIFGKRDPSVTYSLDTRGYSSTGPAESLVTDSSLPSGKKKVIERGLPHVRVRLVRSRFVNGVLDKQETVATSDYPMHPKIIAVGGKVPHKETAAKPVNTLTVGNSQSTIHP